MSCVGGVAGSRGLRLRLWLELVGASGLVLVWALPGIATGRGSLDTLVFLILLFPV